MAAMCQMKMRHRGTRGSCSSSNALGCTLVEEFDDEDDDDNDDECKPGQAPRSGISRVFI